MDLHKEIAFVYAKKMVEIVLAQHGLEWQSGSKMMLFDGSCEKVKTCFSRNVGSVLVAFAKGPAKIRLAEMGELVLRYVTTYDRFYGFAYFFAILYLNKFNRTPLALLKVFCYIIEFSILCRLRNSDMVGAPDVVVGIIEFILLRIDKDDFMDKDGQVYLNQTARIILDDPEYNIKEILKSGEFAW